MYPPVIFPGDRPMHAYRSHTCAALRAGRRRPRGAAVGLGASGARPRRRAVHRPARPLRHHPGARRRREPGLRGAGEGAGRVGDPRRRRGEGARRRASSTRSCRPARSRSTSRDVEVLAAAEELPLPVFGEADYPEETRLKYRFLDLRREQLHANIMLRAKVIAHPARRDARAGLHRVPDADPDRLLARRGRATSWCRAGCIRASSTRCRRRRSSSSS